MQPGGLFVYTHSKPDYTQSISEKVYRKNQTSRKVAENRASRRVPGLYPWYAKLLAALVIAYALSPVDLIPDFIPVLGLLDDLLLLPLGIMLLVKLIPPEVMEECREQAKNAGKEKLPGNYFMAALIILLWVGILALVTYKIIKAVCE